ncbi:MAG TPA: hypothetical protein VFY25_12785, partial [Anaerolineales bacterium]|nr:hypothetical protein [Anaerolineales bacterium]
MRKSFPLLFLILLLASCTTPPATAVHTAAAIPSIIIPTPPSCTTIQVEPTPGPDMPSLFPPENAADHVRGAEQPIVTITEYSDYQDVRSALLAEALERLLEEHPDELRVVSRVFPLISINDKAA